MAWIVLSYFNYLTFSSVIISIACNSCSDILFMSISFHSFNKES
nr:MAG TPA: hypothetical protein [Caudoviricetes sp.]